MQLKVFLSKQQDRHLKHVALHHFHPEGLKSLFNENGFNFKPLLPTIFVHKRIGAQVGQNEFSKADKFGDSFIFVPNYVDAEANIETIENHVANIYDWVH